MDLGIDGKVALVTAASKGLGRGVTPRPRPFDAAVTRATLPSIPRSIVWPMLSAEARLGPRRAGMGGRTRGQGDAPRARSGVRARGRVHADEDARPAGARHDDR